MSGDHAGDRRAQWSVRERGEVLVTKREGFELGMQHTGERGDARERSVCLEIFRLSNRDER